MVYISQTTEFGTIYSKKELTELSNVCHKNHIPLYLDGARLAYALACPENDVTLEDLAKLCDVFYIGGTKCGALFGEAVVIPNPEIMPHFFTIIKQHGALLAKGRIAGIQFGTLFTNHLYENIGKKAIEYAALVRNKLTEKGYELCFGSPSNQVFFVLENRKYKELSNQVEFGFWENVDDDHTIVRVATSWATTEEDVQKLLTIL